MLVDSVAFHLPISVSFRFLLLISHLFFPKQAQTNVSLLNTIVWGTCNTDPTMDECIANMDWFATALQQECTTELKGNYATVVNTLMGVSIFRYKLWSHLTDFPQACRAILFSVKRHVPRTP